MRCPDCDPKDLWCETCKGTHDVPAILFVVPWVVVALGLALSAWLFTCHANAQTCDPDLATEEALCVALFDAAGVAANSSPEPHGRLPGCIELSRAAAVAGLDPALVIALAWHESRMNTEAKSAGGATGLLQVVPSQRRRFMRAQPSSHAEYEPGLWTLSRWLRRHRDYALAIAAYNGGAVREERHHRFARAVLALRARALARVAPATLPGGLDVAGAASTEAP